MKNPFKWNIYQVYYGGEFKGWSVRRWCFGWEYLRQIGSDGEIWAENQSTFSAYWGQTDFKDQAQKKLDKYLKQEQDRKPKKLKFK